MAKVTLAKERAEQEGNAAALSQAFFDLRSAMLSISFIADVFLSLEAGITASLEIAVAWNLSKTAKQQAAVAFLQSRVAADDPELEY